MKTFRIERSDDEHMELFVDETSVGTFNHDEDGWDGMKAAEDLFKRMAAEIGASVRVPSG